MIIFPLGSWLSKPCDETAHRVALLLQSPCATRSRLGHGQYLTRDKNNLFGRLEQSLEDIINAEVVFDKMCSASNRKYPFYQLDKLADIGLSEQLISKEEAKLLITAEKSRLWVITVDDFDSGELTSKIQ